MCPHNILIYLTWSRSTSTRSKWLSARQNVARLHIFEMRGNEEQVWSTSARTGRYCLAGFSRQHFTILGVRQIFIKYAPLLYLHINTFVGELSACVLCIGLIHYTSSWNAWNTWTILLIEMKSHQGNGCELLPVKARLQAIGSPAISSWGHKWPEPFLVRQGKSPYNNMKAFLQ